MQFPFSNETINERRRRVADTLGPHAPIVLVGAGAPVPKPGGLDQTYAFQPHPEYYWLTGSRRWGGVLAFDPQEGFIDFVRPVDAVERLWEGDVESPPGRDVRQLNDWLTARAGRPMAVLGASIEGVKDDGPLSGHVQAEIDALRRVKDDAEIELLRRAAQATTAGFARTRQILRPGLTERDIHIEIEAEFFRNGADDVGYGTIVAAGSHAAVLHSQPSRRVVQRDDVVLIDAGGAVAGYTADVTRTYPAGGRFTAEQQAIYDAVLAAQRAAINRCRDGTEWYDVHRVAAAELAAALTHLDILKIGVEEALATEAIALFFPHGIGHMVGLGVRDVAGRLPGREEIRTCCGAKVRVDLPIRAGFVMTVEPGIYFVPAILDDTDKRSRFAGAVDWDRVDHWRAVGGIRIEDNLLITQAEPQILTAEITK
jgi:Xaa-Pro aminopeptidase